MSLRVDSLTRMVGQNVEDSYGRVLGVLVSLNSDVDGNIKYIEVKVEDRGLEVIPGDRASLKDGKLIVTPTWKYEALKLIEALDRAYRRRKAVESISTNTDIQAEIIEDLKRNLSEEIKNLKIKAEEVKRIIKDRITAIEDEGLQISRSIVNIQTLYFSGELSEKNYTQSINHLRKLREKLLEEKNDAKRTLDKLEKTIEAATSPLEVKKPEKIEQQQKQDQQQVTVQPVVVKVEGA
ncbi:MAG: CdvA-like protein [Acidilobaceae archaeon]